MALELITPGPAGREARSEAGFSLVEALISILLLALVVLGVLPLFSTSIASNRQGRDATIATSFAKSHLEEVVQLDFQHPDLDVNAGTERVHYAYFDRAADEWVEVADQAALDQEDAAWKRVTTIRQFSSDDLSTPLAAGAPLSAIAVKEIVVAIQSSREGGPLGAGKEITARFMKGL